MAKESFSAASLTPHHLSPDTPSLISPSPEYIQRSHPQPPVMQKNHNASPSVKQAPKHRPVKRKLGKSSPGRHALGRSGQKCTRMLRDDDGNTLETPKNGGTKHGSADSKEEPVSWPRKRQDRRVITRDEFKRGSASRGRPLGRARKMQSSPTRGYNSARSAKGTEEKEQIIAHSQGIEWTTRSPGAV